MLRFCEKILQWCPVDTVHLNGQAFNNPKNLISIKIFGMCLVKFEGCHHFYDKLLHHVHS